MSLRAKKQNSAQNFSSDFGVEATQEPQRHTRLNETQRDKGVLTGSEAQNNIAALLTLSVKEYLTEVYQLAEQEHDAADDEVWHSEMFFHAWYAKAHPQIRELTSVEAMAVVKRVWNDVSLGEEDWIDFMTSWDAVKYPAGSTPLGEARRLAALYPMSPSIERGALYGVLLSVACQLQLMRRSEGSFFLSCRAVAPILGCHYVTANSLLRFAVKDGYLAVVKKAIPSSKKGSAATEYRFPIERLPESWKGWERWRR